jgi:hypothetical protein
MPQIRRKVRDVADARQLLAELDRSNLTLADFAHSKGVDGRSLNMYRLNLEDKPTTDTLQLVELVPSAPQPRPSKYVVRYGPLAVEFDEHFDDAVLTRLLRVVTSC